jgi:hypothetical protein
MKRVLMVVMVIAALSSCKKSDNPGTPAVAGYSPVTNGTTWTYLRNSSDSVYKDSVYTFTMTDSTKVISGRTYHAAHSSAGSDVYYCIKDSGYFRTGSLLAGLGIPELATFEELYFKGTGTGDSAWIDTLPFTVVQGGFPLSLKAALNYTLTGVGLTKTVTTDAPSTLTFNDVASVHLDISTYIPGSGTAPLGSANFYYSKAVGLVCFNVTTTIPGSATVNSTFNIKSYTIK